MWNIVPLGLGFMIYFSILIDTAFTLPVAKNSHSFWADPQSVCNSNLLPTREYVLVATISKPISFATFPTSTTYLSDTYVMEETSYSILSDPTSTFQIWTYENIPMIIILSIRRDDILSPCYIHKLLRLNQPTSVFEIGSNLGLTNHLIFGINDERISSPINESILLTLSANNELLVKENGAINITKHYSGFYYSRHLLDSRTDETDWNDEKFYKQIYLGYFDFARYKQSVDQPAW